MGIHETRETTMPTMDDRAYDERQESLFSLEDIDYLINASLTDISREHGVEGLLRRFELQTLVCIRDPEAIEFIYDALQLAISGHEETKLYKGDPYITHPIRVAIRLMRDYDVNDPNIIAAALGHDLVEDEPGKVISILGSNPELANHVHGGNDAQQIALDSIERALSSETSELIRSVTNVEAAPGAQRADKNIEYLQNVGAEIKSSFETFLIKLSDFVDNGVGLHYGEDLKKSTKVAQKYLPVYDLFVEVAECYYKQGKLTRHQYDLTLRKLGRGRQRAQKLLTSD